MANKVELHELRPTPGFTNYVVGKEKDLSGALTSAELKRYYSNIDCEIFFNGHYVEDVSQIQWGITQQTMPLFGYNSHIWDDVAQGTRIISGAFTVHFTKPQPIYDYVDANGSKTNKEAGAINLNCEETISELQKQEVKLNLNNGTTIRSNNVHAPVWANKFDLDIVCGETTENTGSGVHIILQDCYVTSSSSMRTKDGDVAGEMYQFIARDYKTIQ